MLLIFFCLDISSSLCEPDQFVSQEQKALRNNLERALYFMDLIDDDTAHYKKLTLMFLLENGKLALNVEAQVLS